MAKQDSLSELFPPLTDDVLARGLTKWFGEEMEFSHWEYVSKTGQGDSYLSEAVRIKLFGCNDDGLLQSIQIIVKSIPKSVSTRLTFRSDDFFRNEISFYETVLPGLLKFQSTKNIEDPFDNYAKIFYTYSDGINDVICLEDASAHGFGNAVRQEGIDLDHVKVTFKTVAKFHALSFAMKDQNPDDFDVLKDAIFETCISEEHIDWYGTFWNKLCGIAIDAVEKEYPNTIYVDKVKQFAVPERVLEMAKHIRTSEHAVISHGDCWTNNYLYKYVNERPVDAKMIDFQIARYASPTLDLSIVIYACTTQDLRDKHYDEMLRYYHNALTDQIRQLGSDPEELYSWNTFMEEVKKYFAFGLGVSFDTTPFIVLPPEEAFNMDLKGEEKLNIADVWQVTNFKTKEGRLREANNVVHCVDNGYI